MADGFDQRLCDKMHAEQDRRMTAVEAAHSELQAKVDGNLGKMYAKIEQETLVYANKAIEMAKRPGWATVAVIGFLSSLSVGLLVARYGGH